MKQRIYTVTTPAGVRLISATSRNQASARAAKDMITVAITSKEDLVSFLTSGTKVEFAAQEEE